MIVSAPEIIRNLIKGFDVSKEGLADKMGVSVMTIIRWGNGKPIPNRANLRLLNAIYRGHKSIKRKR